MRKKKREKRSKQKKILILEMIKMNVKNHFLSFNKSSV